MTRGNGRVFRSTFLHFWIAILLYATVSGGLAQSFLTNPNPTLTPGSSQAGICPTHVLTLDVVAGELEVYEVEISFAESFGFAGFADADSSGAAGMLEWDAGSDAITENSANLLAIDAVSAFVDLVADGDYSPGWEPFLSRSSPATFTLIMPLGGDANDATVVYPDSGTIIITLVGGQVVSPGSAGLYPVTIALTSVDPDSDGPDDGSAQGPVSQSFPLNIAVEPDVVFASGFEAPLNNGAAARNCPP